jgi:excisionase family DNA binding protein
MPKTSGSNRKYLSLKDLARWLRCSQRTVREYCKRGKIPEAIRTRGGQWRIRRPLSGKTQLFLQKIRGDWPFDGSSDAEGEIELDWAEMLMLAQLCEMDLDDFIATSYLPGVKEPSQDECLFVAHNSNEAEEPNKEDPGETKKRQAASRIRSAIYERPQSGTSLSGMILIGQVYQFWRKKKRRPTVAEIAQQMHMSRSDFYRRYTAQELRRAYRTASGSGELKRDLPDPGGLDPVQRANRNAKKCGFTSLQRDYDPPSTPF